MDEERDKPSIAELLAQAIASLQRQVSEVRGRQEADRVLLLVLMARSTSPAAITEAFRRRAETRIARLLASDRDTADVDLQQFEELGELLREIADTAPGHDPQ